MQGAGSIESGARLDEGAERESVVDDPGFSFRLGKLSLLRGWCLVLGFGVLGFGFIKGLEFGV